ncbi:PLP-dependent transferase [Acinetobacter sp. WZC-1]|uniref:PLP-dependent transferase n=1 Tax=Acinetobacter sp. WZC-1 TaxID=3459034 RepID=UPI00403E090D
MKKKSQTALLHAPRNAPQYISTIQPPLYRASTIIFKNTDALFNRHWSDAYDYSYGTHGTPTTYTLADSIARIEGGDFCLLAPSGLSAIQLVNASFLNHGDEVWVADNIYSPNMEHLRYLKTHCGIVVRVYNPLDANSFIPSDRTRLLWLEAAGSLTLEFPDLKKLVQKAQQAQVLTALDNTWGAGLAFHAFDFSDEHLSVDISVHALTKYPSGGGDILMGAVTTKNKTLHHRLLSVHAIQGISISGDDAAQIQRSLPSMQIRYEHQAQSARMLLEWLKQQSEFAQVLHPANPDNVASHQFWLENCPTGKSAGLISVIFKQQYDLIAVRQFCDALSLFKLGFSWAGPISLVMLYDLKQVRTATSAHLQQGLLVRFCIGLEDPEDLIQDIAQALHQLKSHSDQPSVISDL